MAWTAPATAVTGDVITAAFWNTNGRDNLLETAVAKATSAGIQYSTAANALAHLAASGNGSKFLRFNSGATAVEAASVPTAPAPAFDWQSVIASAYTAAFASSDVVDSVTGDLYDYGWSSLGTPTIVNPTQHTGDFNAAADDDPAYLYFGTALQRAHSPAIVGGFARLQAVKQLLGQTATTITVWFVAKFPNTANSANDIGFGLASDEAAARVGAAGSIALMCGATYFEHRLGTDAGVSLAVAIDTSWHLFEFVITVADGTVDIKIDGTERASNLAPAADQWPKNLFGDKNSVGGGGTLAIASMGVQFA